MNGIQDLACDDCPGSQSSNSHSHIYCAPPWPSHWQVPNARPTLAGIDLIHWTEVLEGAVEASDYGGIETSSTRTKVGMKLKRFSMCGMFTAQHMITQTFYHSISPPTPASSWTTTIQWSLDQASIPGASSARIFEPCLWEMLCLAASMTVFHLVLVTLTPMNTCDIVDHIYSPAKWRQLLRLTE